MKRIKKIFKWTGILLGAVLLIFSILVIIPESETIPPIEPRENTKYWEMSEGFNIAYTHLNGIDSLNKAPVIFLHGGPGGYVHSSIIETLGSLTETGHDVYLYDQRGSGLSDRLDKYSDVSFKKHLHDLHEIITQKIGASKVILIGQSFGSVIIAHYSAQHNDRIKKIIFSSPGTFRPYRKIAGSYADIDSIYSTPDSLNFIEPYNFIKDVDNMAMKPKAMVASTGALLFDKKLISDKQMDRMLNTLASQFTKGMVCDPENVLPEEGGGGLYAYIATNSDDYPEIRDKVQKVEVPVLVMQGQCEYHSFASAYEYVDLYPNSQYEFIENAGHEIWWENEVEYIKTITEFIEK
ncbi:alpha/beta hydrolase [Galbibacter sp. EGI 63066]|uniref:alpha/beta hydrolase n=1 Tax=Galbibacter sp. EGI 63066 TaxID=2993559 RepID=UPI002248F0AE|nr:alpha/beta hydrolase [Galbibacter sp. EGI 63066]MCX2680068.1 alpha/beta hydrolase [Galbibacter sp. EGI 63066]